MNKYEIFFTDLKNYLIENKFQDKSEFNTVSIKEIQRLELLLPLAYIEWLKIFGNTSCLLNYPIEDYTLEELEYAQEDEDKNRIFQEESRKLILISVFQDLNTYIVQDEENPNTYQINIGNDLFPEKLRNKGTFTTHIKKIIIHLINNEREKLSNWFIEDIIDYTKSPFEENKIFLHLLKNIETLEEEEDKIYTINETVKMWNSII